MTFDLPTAFECLEELTTGSSQLIPGTLNCVGESSGAAAVSWVTHEGGLDIRACCESGSSGDLQSRGCVYVILCGE